MIDRDEAKMIAMEAISKQLATANSVVIIDDATIDTGYGWVFFYNTEQFLQTGKFEYMLLGNCPVLIQKATGDVHFLTEHPRFELALRAYEQQNRMA